MSNKKLLNQFYFGFELEGTYNYSAIDRYQLTKEFNKRLNGQGDMHGDGSLRADYGYETFEYSSPVIQFTPKNLKMVLDFFDSLPSLNVKINRTCGLHTHISFEGINKENISWAIASMVADESYKDFLKFNKTNFFNRTYASYRYLENAKRYLDRNYISTFSNTLVDNDKYRVFRIHPQGTLEWRGPRIFLNVNNHKKNVLYIKKLTALIKRINDSLDMVEVNGLKRDDFIRASLSSFRVLEFVEKTKTNNYAKLYSRIVNNPEILNHLKDDVLDKFLSNYTFSPRTLLDSMSDNKFVIKNINVLGQLLNHFNITNLSKFITLDLVKNNMDYLGQRNSLTPLFKHLLANPQYNDEVLKFMMKQAIENFGLSSIRTFTYNAMVEMIKYNPEVFKIASSKNLVELFGQAKAGELLLTYLRKINKNGIDNLDLYNLLMKNNADLLNDCQISLDTSLISSKLIQSFL